MLRWIAFDDETATGIDQHMGPGTAQVESGDALSLALSLTTPSVVVLRSSTPGQLVLANIRKSPLKQAEIDPLVSFEPSGFLGLSDTPMFLEATSPPQKHWWQRKKAA